MTGSFGTRWSSCICCNVLPSLGHWLRCGRTLVYSLHCSAPTVSRQLTDSALGLLFLDISALSLYSAFVETSRNPSHLTPAWNLKAGLPVAEGLSGNYVEIQQAYKLVCPGPVQKVSLCGLNCSRPQQNNKSKKALQARKAI